MVEAMTQGGFKPRGRFFAPADAFTAEPVIYSYLKDYLEGIEVLREGGAYSVGGVSFRTPRRHVHPVETYGLLFDAGGHRFAYIADTRYFADLPCVYTSDLLIINVVFPQEVPPADHLTVPDVRRIVTEAKPKVAIMTHFGMSMWRVKPWEIAQELSEETGIWVIAARDGMKFDLTQLDQEAG
jgi:phosphoribosyl 1,2-cyclic phosphodiesterase